MTGSDGVSAAPATAAARRAAPSTTRRRSVLGGRRGQYLVIRVTGVMLAVLALGHYGLTHVVNDVADTDAAFVTRRWSSALWVCWDGLLLGTALLHAVAGTATVIRDHRADPRSRRRWLLVASAATAVLFVIGIAALTFAVLDNSQ